MSTAVAPLTREQILAGPVSTLRERRKATIYSVYPADLPPKELSWFAGFKPYKLEPAPRDGYTKLDVEETVQWVRDTSSFGDDNQNGDMRPVPIDYRLRAMNLVAHWGGNTVGAKAGHAPGIDVYDGEEGTPEFDKFITSLRSRQQSFFQWLVQDANDKHTVGDAKNITDLHRAAAKWLLDSGAERLPWYPKIELAALKRCAACNAQIDAQAKTCTSCREDLIAYFIKYEYLDRAVDPLVFDIADGIKNARAARPIPGSPINPPTQPHK